MKLRPIPRARPPKKWAPIPEPITAEATYAHALVTMVERSWRRIRAALAPVLKQAQEDWEALEAEKHADGLHLDAKPKKLKAAVTFEVVMEDLPEKAQAEFSLGPITRVAEKTAKSVDVAHLRETRKQFAKSMGIQVLKEAPELEPVVREFTKRNVDLIKSLPKETLEALKKEMAPLLDKGTRAETLAKVMEERYGVEKRRAQFIARDQVGKLQASLTEERHKQLGITRYRWRTVRDNRVRRKPVSHVKREGVIFEYAKPPHENSTDGHAGMPPRCRCWQEPIVDDVLPPKQAVKLERTVPDPAPPEAPRPSRAVVPVFRGADLLAKAKADLEAAKKRIREAKTPTRAKKAKAEVKKLEAKPLPVDRTKGWKHTRVYEVPLEELDDVPAMAWNGREKSINKAYDEGKESELPPIMVSSERGSDARELSDGNHRLAVARARGAKTIKVRFSDRKAASTIARPPRPWAPHFIRDMPGNFGFNPDGTPKKK